LAALENGRQLVRTRRPERFDSNSPYLPAMTWYTGILYSWPGLRQRLDKAFGRGVRCLIVSAGYGLLRPDDSINWYNLQMGQTLSIWNKILPLVLADYATRNGCGRIFGVLSNQYHQAVANVEHLLPSADVTWHVPLARELAGPGSPMQKVSRAIAAHVVELVDRGFGPHRDEPTNANLQIRLAPEVPHHPCGRETSSLVNERRSHGSFAERFRSELMTMFGEAEAEGKAHLDVVAKDLHRRVGGYPGPNHRMPICCSVMRAQMGPDDRLLRSPPSGQGANLMIRYHLPRLARHI
jgi:5-methylcytosine-specific restriction protein A